MKKKTLVIQGGGFRTSFTAGVLDAFMTQGYNPFDSYIAVSGGSIALSYYLSGQYKKCYEAMCLLAEDKNFMRLNRLVSSQGVMNVDYFMDVANDKVHFDLVKAFETVEGKELAFVMTNRISGEPHYYHPSRKTWIDGVIASCTMPFVTKGKHSIHGEEFFDGGWSDPLPVEWACRNGAKDILVIRTAPGNIKVNQSWSDYFGSLVFRSNDKLRACFETNHLVYNASVDFMNDPPDGINLTQIAPEAPLQTGTYSNSVKLISEDYRYGLECGLNYLQELKGFEGS